MERHSSGLNCCGCHMPIPDGGAYHSNSLQIRNAMLHASLNGYFAISTILPFQPSMVPCPDVPRLADVRFPQATVSQ